jgi:hypothetical protein
MITINIDTLVLVLPPYEGDRGDETQHDPEVAQRHAEYAAAFRNGLPPMQEQSLPIPEKMGPPIISTYWRPFGGRRPTCPDCGAGEGMLHRSKCPRLPIGGLELNPREVH